VVRGQIVGDQHAHGERQPGGIAELGLRGVPVLAAEEGEVAAVVPRDEVVRLPFIGDLGMAPHGQFHLYRERFQQVAVGQQFLHAHTVAGRTEYGVSAGAGLGNIGGPAASGGGRAQFVPFPRM
jgi:hypothetical protein